MCTRSGRHSTASHTSNSASGRLARHRYSSPRNHARIPRPRAPPGPSWTPSFSQGILNATATARHRLQVLWKEPENDDAVAVCHHGDTLDKTGEPRQPGRYRLNNKLRRPRSRLPPEAGGDVEE